jgi:hypothetical protein
MLRGAWICQALSTVTRLDIPDLLDRHGALTAAQLTKEHGVLNGVRSSSKRTSTCNESRCSTPAPACALSRLLRAE